MSKMIFVSLLIALSLVALAGCSAGAGQEVRIGDADQGSTVELATGQTLVVSLVSNPTTGYSWGIMEVDDAILAQQGEVEYQQDPSSEGLVGAGGTEFFRFSAQKAGETTLSLGYRRPWEADVEPIAVFTVQVVVR